jgi:hypothetical protein
MPDHYGDLKSIKIKENMLYIRMRQHSTDTSHMIRKNEFIGVSMYDSSAQCIFIHYPPITFTFQEQDMDHVGKIIKELFAEGPKDFVGDLLAA